MRRSRDGDATDVAGAVEVIGLTCTGPRVWCGTMVFEFSFLILGLFLMKFQLLPILCTNVTYIFPILSEFSFYFKFCIA
jgi:hypothetical protein